MVHPNATRHESTSPSLTRTGKGSRAFEIKFILNEPAAQTVEKLVAAFLHPDPHTDPVSGDYTVTSIYCDTPEWDVYHREGIHAHRKFRVRRYGPAGPVFVERKSVRKSIVRKRRSAGAVDPHESLILADPAAAWFVGQVNRAALRPVCRITYQRRAYFGIHEGGPMRVTFDRHARGHPLAAWSFNGLATPKNLLDNLVVCEFKFRDAMPTPMKSIVASLGLTPGRISKYRACIHAFADELGVPRGAGNA